MKLMPQLQAQVPDPLSSHLPGFLSSRRVRAPAIGVKLLVFIGEHGFKGTTMQIQLYHIRGGEAVLRELGEKKFVDQTFAGLTDAALFRCGRVGGHYDTAAAACLAYRDIGAVVERAYQGTFRAVEVGIGRQVEPCLPHRVIQHRVVLASHHKEETSKIRENGPGSVESIQSEQG